MTIAQERCFHHAGREAVARCPECQRFFCRECVTEHGDRVICAVCLKNLAVAPERSGPRFTRLGLIVNSLLGLLMLWVLFYAIGQALLSLPSAFHEGTLWKAIPTMNL